MADEQPVESNFDQKSFLNSILQSLGDPPPVTEVSLDRFPMLLFGAEPTTDFVESVRMYGVLEPVIAFKDEESDELRIIGGNRRVKAARLAGYTKIRATVYPGSAVNAYSTLAVMLNEQRSSNPILEFEAIKDLQGRGLTLSQIASVTGMSIGTVKRRVHLANLDDAIYNHAKLGGISAGVLQETAKLPAEDQKAIADKALLGHRVTHEDIDKAKTVNRKAEVSTLPDAIFAAPEKKPTERILAMTKNLMAEIERIGTEVLPGEVLLCAGVLLQKVQACHDGERYAQPKQEVPIVEEPLGIDPDPGMEPYRDDASELPVPEPEPDYTGETDEEHDRTVEAAAEADEHGDSEPEQFDDVPF